MGIHPLSTPPKVKICGLRHAALEQAREIAALGADFLGLNLWPESRRYLPVEDLATFQGHTPLDEALCIGVMVNPSLSYVREAWSIGVLSAIQLHGDESPEYCAQLQEEGIPLIKAFQVKDANSLEAIAAYPVMDILLDAYHPQARGGIGESFPWTLALDFQQHYPQRRLYLAGGLTPENVGTAAHGMHPYAVDVASGVESGTPGLKDLKKVRAFIQGAKASL